MDDMNQGENRQISISRIQIWARFGVQRSHTLRNNFPTQENKKRNVLTEPEMKGSTFLSTEDSGRVWDIYYKKKVKGHSTEKIKHSCFPNNLNNEDIYTSRGTPRTIVRAPPKLEEQTELGWYMFRDIRKLKTPKYDWMRSSTIWRSNNWSCPNYKSMYFASRIACHQYKHPTVRRKQHW